MFSPKGSNLNSLAQNQMSCQLDEGKIYGQYVNELFSFFVEVSIRFELMTPGYKAGILPTILRDQIFGYKKTRTCFEFGSYIPFIFLVNLYQLINENALICDLSVRYTLNDH